MKQRLNRFCRAGLSAAAALCAFAAFGNAMAAGTDAGTTVSNSFTLDFSVGGVPQTQITPPASTDFTVDRLVNVTVTSQGDTSVAPGQTGAETVFSVVNIGNDAQQYAFTIEDVAGDDFDIATYTLTYYRDTNDNGVLEVGTDTLVGTIAQGAASADVAPDERLFVVVSGDIPGSAADTDQDQIALIADSLNPAISLDPGYTGTPGAQTVADTGGNTIGGEAENVLADLDGPATADAATDGAHSDTAAFIVASADLAATKAVAVIATDGGAITCATDPAVAGDQYTTPGACIEYTITVVNNSTSPSPAGDATAIALADSLPTDITFVGATSTVFTGGTISTTDLGGTPVTCTAASPECVVRLTGATLVSGATGTLVIRALVE